MLALVAADVVAAILFGAVYAAAGAGYLSQLAFVGCLLILFGIATSLWVQAETRNQGLPPIRRLTRAVLALVIVLFAMPALGLMPLFWLDTQLPEEAGLRAVLAPVMALLLISLVLVVLVNVVGSLIVAGRALLAGRLRPSR